MSYGIPSNGYRPLSADGLNPMQIFRRVASRKRLLFVVAGIVFISLTAIIYRLQPLYTASAQIVIPRATHKALKRLAVEREVPITVMAQKAIESYLAQAK